MSVLYLTYIPLPVTTNPRPSNTDISQSLRHEGRHSLDDNESEKVGNTDHVDGKGVEAARSSDSENWRTLRQCAQVLSLCRVRDAMGTGMQPMMGYLRYVFIVSQHSQYSPTFPDRQPAQTNPSGCRPRDRKILSNDFPNPHSSVLRLVLDPHPLFSRCRYARTDTADVRFFIIQKSDFSHLSGSRHSCS